MSQIAFDKLPCSSRLGKDLRARVAQLHSWFHQHPELAFQEEETAQHICRALDGFGIPYQYAGVGHAVIGTIAGRSADRPLIALRAEMDALPGDESTQARYKSIYPGRVHACGHCAHMAMLLGGAQLLIEDPPPGPVRLVFQPAEEKGGGARTAIDDGALDSVDSIYAVHVAHDYETGIIMVRYGGVTAQSDGFTIRIRGKGGHGARPHEAVDAVIVSGFLIMALQTLVSREANPLHPSVVTIGSVNSGSAAYAIAETAILSGSIRTSQPESRKRGASWSDTDDQRSGRAAWCAHRAEHPGRLPTGRERSIVL